MGTHPARAFCGPDIPAAGAVVCAASDLLVSVPVFGLRVFVLKNPHIVRRATWEPLCVSGSAFACFP